MFPVLLGVMLPYLLSAHWPFTNRGITTACTITWVAVICPSRQGIASSSSCEAGQDFWDLLVLANVYADKPARMLGVYEHAIRVARKFSSFCLVCCAWGLMEAAEWTESCQSWCAVLDLFYEWARSAGWDWFALCNVLKFL